MQPLMLSPQAKEAVSEHEEDDGTDFEDDKPIIRKKAPAKPKAGGRGKKFKDYLCEKGCGFDGDFDEVYLFRAPLLISGRLPLGCPNEVWPRRTLKAHDLTWQMEIAGCSPRGALLFRQGRVRMEL